MVRLIDLDPHLLRVYQCKIPHALRQLFWPSSIPNSPEIVVTRRYVTSLQSPAALFLPRKAQFTVFFSIGACAPAYHKAGFFLLPFAINTTFLRSYPYTSRGYSSEKVRFWDIFSGPPLPRREKKEPRVRRVAGRGRVSSTVTTPPPPPPPPTTNHQHIEPSGKKQWKSPVTRYGNRYQSP